MLSENEIPFYSDSTVVGIIPCDMYTPLEANDRDRNVNIKVVDSGPFCQFRDQFDIFFGG